MENWYVDAGNRVVKDYLKHDRHRDMNQVKHVIEHRINTPKTYHLPPLHPPQPQHVPQQVIQQIPHPVIQRIGLDDNQPQKGSLFNKADLMEMMMMQGAQMHQLVMQQMMMSNLPGNPRTAYPAVLAEPAAPVMMNRAGGAVHHHHYQMSPPPQPTVHHYPSLPAIQPTATGLPGPTGAMTPVRVAATGRPEPARALVLPRGQVSRPRSISPPPVAAKRAVKRFTKHAFPGPKALRRFRHIAYAAWFISILRAAARKNVGNRPSSVFLFGIILKEIVAALHRIYLNPSGNIYPVLADVVSPQAYDLTNLLRDRSGDKETSVMLQELQYVVENLIYHITEIMPSSGVLGTHRKSAVFELVRNGKRFPDGYFWQAELDRLQFTDNGRTANIGDAEAFLLIVGIFISRSLVTTLLMKPVDYGLSSQPLTDVAERNLKILATTMLYLVRRVSTLRGKAMLPPPGEISKYLYTDEEMRPIYSKLGRSFNYSEGLLREWGQEYIKRLRAAPLANK
ncbi:uncharacterized protein LOC132550904 [Ylistrum balloti]|uniref:uncharacterized protein LOC132550904 n=1 Tax=Ylistrum balloti TaxID=509963 RepID=UPI002905EAFA|nr:uncharacterized protein LOC132550904 [Ylistrum balloti]